jgi:hypothetical protein
MNSLTIRNIIQEEIQRLTEEVSLEAISKLQLVLHTLDSLGVDDPEFYIKEIRRQFQAGFKELLQQAAVRLKTVEQRRQLSSKVRELLAPLQTATTFKDLIHYIDFVTKEVKALGPLDEALNFKAAFQTIGQHLKGAGAKAKQWWDNNKMNLAKLVIEFLLQLMLEIVFALINGLLKSNIKTPKVRFKGGDFGGGGAGGEW